MSETIGAALIFAGLAAVLAAVGWMLVAGVAVALRRRAARRLLVPLALLGAGLVVGAAPFAWQRLFMAVVGLGERERVIDGDLAVNLTGWDRRDYGILARKPDVAILEMGNADVGDETLPLLLALPKLRELTLNDSGVTDAGLPVLARLERIESLRLARTRVTPDGVRAFLAAPPPRLRRIDVSGNGIPTGILREWRNAAPAPEAGGPEEERRYVN
jgi:hypothetical protein